MNEMELMDTYNPIVEQLRATNVKLRQRVAELERFHVLDTKQIAYLFEERNLLTTERDELIEVKAAENASWNAGFNVQADQIAKLTAERDELMALVVEARATLEMWKDVAPAVSLCADMDAAIASVKEKA